MTQSTAQAISVLNDAQAAKALRLLYDRTPPEHWEDGGKPSEERLRTVVDALREDAAETDRHAVETLLAPASLRERGTLARLVLTRVSQSSALRPYVDQAVTEAAKRDMMFDPAAGVFVIGMLLATSKVAKTKDGFTVELGGGAKDIIGALRVPEVLAKLPAIIKALPSEILSRLLPNG